MITSAAPINLAFSLWFFATLVLTYAFYIKAAITDPGTIRTQLFLNQNTEETANTVRKNKQHARKPSSVQ